jgi:hypothetical protein
MKLRGLGVVVNPTSAAIVGAGAGTRHALDLRNFNYTEDGDTGIVSVDGAALDKGLLKVAQISGGLGVGAGLLLGVGLGALIFRRKGR